MKKDFKILHVVICLTLFLVIGNFVFATSPGTKQTEPSTKLTEHFKIIRIKGESEKLNMAEIAKKLESSYSDVCNYLGITHYMQGKIEVVISNRGMRWKGGDASQTKIHLALNYINTNAMRHELTHVLIAKVLPTMPRWFNEGVAQYIGYGHIMSDYKRYIQHERNYKKSLRHFPTGFSFAKLNLKFNRSDIEQRINFAAYAYSYAIVSYLVDKYGEEIFKRMFEEKGSFSKRFKKAYGMELKTLEKKVKKMFSDRQSTPKVENLSPQAHGGVFAAPKTWINRLAKVNVIVEKKIKWMDSRVYYQISISPYSKELKNLINKDPLAACEVLFLDKDGFALFMAHFYFKSVIFLKKNTNKVVIIAKGELPCDKETYNRIKFVDINIIVDY